MPETEGERRQPPNVRSVPGSIDCAVSPGGGHFNRDWRSFAQFVVPLALSC
jgi:hypothetical protein